MEQQQPKRKIIDSRMAIIIVGQLLVILVVASSLLYLKNSENKIDDNLIYRDVAGKLQAAGILEEAILNYIKYWEQLAIDNQEKGNIAMTVADLYKQLGQYQLAISWYYKSLATNLKENQINEVNKNIVNALEKLGKTAAANYTLKEVTSLNKNETKNGGDIVATVDNTPVYLYEINDYQDKLPDSMKKDFLGREGKIKLLQKIVADKLLLYKAQKLGIRERSEIKKQLKEIEDQLLVNQVIKEEVEQKIVIDESDVQNYYSANKDKYIDSKSKKKLEFAKIKEQVKQDYKVQKISMAYQKMIEDIAKNQEVKIFEDKIK